MACDEAMSLWHASPMEFTSKDGRFWLPRQPERSVHGVVAFQEDGVTLTLEGALHAPAGSGSGPIFATEPVILGHLRDGSQATLYQASGLTWPVDGIEEVWQAEFLLIGGLAPEDRFTQAQIIFDYLTPWVQPVGMAAGGFGGGDVVIKTSPVTIDQATLTDRTKIRLWSGVDGSSNASSVHFDQWTAIELTSLAKKPRSVRKILDDWVRPLQDLLVISLGRPVSISHFAVRPKGQANRVLPLEVACQLIQPPAASPATMNVNSYSSPALLTYRDSPLPFSELIPNWFELHERLYDVITDLCGPFYAPFIYSGHRYSSTFQSAEGLAKILFGAKQKERRQHKQRVEAVTNALMGVDLDEDILTWAKAVLQNRNDKPLQQLIDELITAADVMGVQLRKAAPDLAREAATARAGVSHSGTVGTSIVRRYWLGEAIVWLVRAQVLAELGIPIGDLAARAVQKASFTNVVNWLKAADSRPRSNTPGYRHGGCPINHRTKDTMARCRNQ